MLAWAYHTSDVVLSLDWAEIPQWKKKLVFKLIPGFIKRSIHVVLKKLVTQLILLGNQNRGTCRKIGVIDD